MSRYHGIGEGVKKLHGKLTQSLAGPLRAWLPDEWIAKALGEIGYRFRRTDFSPSGDAVGLHRTGPRPRSFLQPCVGEDPGASRRAGSAPHLRRHRRLLQGAQTPAGSPVLPLVLTQRRSPGRPGQARRICGSAGG